MVEDSQTKSAQLLPTDQGFTLVGCIILLVPALIAFGGAFAPTTRGPWLAFAFLMPAIIFSIIRGAERRSSGYRITTAHAVLPVAGILGILAAFVLPFSFVGIGEPFLWWIWIALAAALSAGILVGLARHDHSKQKRLISRRYRQQGGRLVIDPNKEGIMAMKASTGSSAIDMLVKCLWVLFMGLITVGMFLGGATGFVLIHLFGDLFVPPPGLDIRVLVIEAIALIAIGPLGMVMPSLWRGWREIARLEELCS